MKNKLLLFLSAFLLAIGIARAAEINDLNITDSSNTTRFPENMAPSAVNDSARALEGLIARWHKDIAGTVTDYGPANSLRITPNRTISSLYEGLTFLLKASTTNTGSSTLQIGNLATSAIKKHGDQNLASGDIEANQKILVTYDGTNFQILSGLASNVSTSGSLAISSNLSDVASAAAARTNIDAQQDVITAQGDLVIGSASATATNFAIGSSNTYLKSTGTTVTWASTSTGLGGLTMKVFTANASYAKPSTLGFVIIEVIGAGGGGSGLTGSPTNIVVGSGGGGGGYSRKLIAAGSLGAIETVTIGAAGTAGSAGDNPGGNGGTSSFGAHASATGGTGGINTTGTSIRGGPGGAGSGGDLNAVGGPGDGGVSIVASTTGRGYGGNGGNSVYGGGGTRPTNDAAGTDGGAYGGGGSGGQDNGGSTNRAGGAGAAGVVIVTEYQ